MGSFIEIVGFIVFGMGNGCLWLCMGLILLCVIILYDGSGWSVGVWCCIGEKLCLVRIFWLFILIFCR